jgi:hypothetical protein
MSFLHSRNENITFNREIRDNCRHLMMEVHIAVDAAPLTAHWAT